LDEARDRIARRDKGEEQRVILEAELAKPAPSFRRADPPPRLKNYRPKIDTPHVHPWLGVHDVDQRIERALEGERERADAQLERAVVAMGAFAAAVETVVQEVREEVSRLKVENAKLSVEICELRTLIAERRTASGGEVVSLPRRQSH
jgi:hypothetical protein